jgi:hypothetical protein
MKICKNGHEFEDDGKKSNFCPACRSKMGKRSKNKGSSNERRLSKMMQNRFDRVGLKYRVRRTPASGAIHEFEPADLLFSGLPLESIFRQLHFEAKDTAQWSVKEWVKDAEQKERDTGGMRMPLVIMRHPNEQDEYAVMRVEHLLDILINLEKLITEKY